MNHTQSVKFDSTAKYHSDSKTNSSSVANWLKSSLDLKDLTKIHFKKNNNWIQKTHFEYLKDILAFQNFLKLQNVKQDDFVALMTPTSYLWTVCDIATVSMGAILVPIYPNLTDDDVQYILEHSESKIVFSETKNGLEQLERLHQKSEKKQFSFFDLGAVELNQEINSNQIQQMIEDCAKIASHHPFTLIYTSGTTGTPKGVLLNHSHIISEIEEAFSLFEISPEDCSLAFLPYAHIMGRIEHWGCLYSQCQLAFAESIDTLKLDLVAIKPTFLVAVPRIFEKIYAGILTKVETSTLKNNLFQRTLKIAKTMNYYNSTLQAAPLLDVLEYEVLKKIVLKPIQNAFGGRLRFAISGGAPLSADLGQFFAYIGIKILEGYGLTETTAAITVNTETQWKIGTVGKPIGDVKIKIAPDGELLVKSGKCFSEYYKNPEATAESFDEEGFFRTGDIGEFTEDGFLKITDRKKNLLKTSGGKYVVPQKLENLLKKEPLISQVLICGDQKKYVAALIVVDQLNSDSPLDEKQKVLNKVKTHIQAINAELSSFETIKKFEVIFEPWTPENGFLTPSMKVKRKVIENFYKDIINKLFD